MRAAPTPEGWSWGDRNQAIAISHLAPRRLSNPRRHIGPGRQGSVWSSGFCATHSGTLSAMSKKSVKKAAQKSAKEALASARKALDAAQKATRKAKKADVNAKKAQTAARRASQLEQSRSVRKATKPATKKAAAKKTTKTARKTVSGRGGGSNLGPPKATKKSAAKKSARTKSATNR
jgi:hypothetical protein